MQNRLYCGDNLEIMISMPESSVDSIVTDPPYGLSSPKNSGKNSKGGFMNKLWDHDVPSIELWREALRVLKPGAHILVACGTRTQHRMAINIEDAGFEIRDVITYHYGSGFPKSLDVSKSLDREAGLKRKVIGCRKSQLPTSNGKYASDKWSIEAGKKMREIDITEPASDEAKKWSGFGTGLKPATEFWTLARRPLQRGLTVAGNVLKFGCGAINIDQSRIETLEKIPSVTNQNIKSGAYNSDNVARDRDTIYNQHAQGRWPSNAIFDEAQAFILDQQSGPASRFFFCAKASESERNAGLGTLRCNHPTVKPVKLMEYLVRLITPPNGTCLDPFLGSGSTGVASINLKVFNFIGIEKQSDYFEIAKKRLVHAEKLSAPKTSKVCRTGKPQSYSADQLKFKL